SLVSERTEEGSLIEPVTPQEPSTTNLPISDVTILIKEEKVITANDLVTQFGEYDPKLDLSGYQYPTLDILDAVSSDDNHLVSEKELEDNKSKIVNTLKSFNIEIESIKAN